jgi:hypothetical protein
MKNTSPYINTIKKAPAPFREPKFQNWTKPIFVCLIFLLFTLTAIKPVVACLSGPDSDFNADKTKPVVGETVTFTNTTNYGSGNDGSYTWTWNFGSEANPATATTNTRAEKPTTTYITTGQKTVVLTTTWTAWGGGNNVETKTNYINVGATPTPGSIGGTQDICSEDTPALLTNVTAGGGSSDNPLTYQWQTNASGSYVTITGATSATYQPPALTFTTSYQRRTVTDWGGIPRYSTWTTPVTITVNNNVTPTFDQVAAICSGESLAALPTTSNNGITGTWAPALNKTATTLYTFTPTTGQCATTATMTIVVNALPDAPTAVNNTTTYNGAVQSASATVGAGETVDWYTTETGSITASAPSATNVGTYTAWAEARNTTTGCVSASRTEVTLEIGKADLSVTTVAGDITYGDAEPAVSVEYSGFIGTEDATVLDNVGFALSTDYTQGDDVGTYNTTIAMGSATDNNYSLNLITSTFDVGQRVITITADVKGKTYGEADPALTYQITSGSIYGSDAPTGSLSRVAGEDVGTYAIQQNDLTYGNNYDETYAGADLTIGKADLAVTAVAGDITYGDAEPTPAVEYSGFAGTDDATVLDNVGFDLGTDYTQGDDVGTYNTTIAMGTATDNNYNFTPLNTSTFEVGTLAITITADAKSKTYGEADPALTYQITSGSIYGSDAPTGSLSRVAGEDVGTYAIQQNDLTYGSNYNETYVGADLTIGAKTLTPQITADNKCYNGTTTATLNSQTLDGVESGDVVSLEVTSSNFANVGPGTGITVTASGLNLSGTDAGNYSVASTATTTADIYELPAINLTSSSAALCHGELVAYFYYSFATGDTYSIDFNATAEGQGFVNVSGVTLSGSEIEITVPGSAQPDTYSAELTVTNSTTGCTSEVYNITIIIHPLPATGEIIPD